MDQANLLLFILEAVVYFSVMVTFLHFRHLLGLGVFLCALGVMHFMETYLAAVFYVELPFGTASPGSSILFTSKLMMILMLYLEEDAETVRQPIYGLFLGNILTVSMAWLVQLHITVPIGPGRMVDLGFLKEMGWLMVWGTALLYIDSLGVILLYERLGRFMRRWIVLRFMIASFVLLTFDQLGFFAALHYLLGAPSAVFWNGWVAKMLSVCLYGGLFAVYQFLVRRHPIRGRALRPIADVFSDLTFRERYHELLSRSGRDSLTGAFARNQLELDGPRMFREGRLIGEALTLLLVDADHFKAINDRFGHLQGDEVLKAIVSQISSVLRPQDRLYRYGGEEFIILLPSTSHTDGIGLGERLRWHVSANVSDPESRPITISVGVATESEGAKEFNSLIGLADKRLYEAKRVGRDCVVGRDGRVVAA